MVARLDRGLTESTVPAATSGGTESYEFKIENSRPAVGVVPDHDGFDGVHGAEFIIASAEFKCATERAGYRQLRRGDRRGSDHSRERGYECSLRSRF